MADNHDLLKCPLCDGHGEIRVSVVLQLLRDQTLEDKINRGLSESPGKECKPDAELEFATAARSEQRDFQQDVHSWNPQLAMWRRSPKE
jgi:hypothetical protein